MNVSMGSKASLRSMLFEPPRQRDIDYLRERIESRLDVFDNHKTRYTSSIMDTFERINNSQALFKARELYRKARGLFVQDSMDQLWDIETMQAAKADMQRFIMAMPELRNLYHKQRIDGYSDTYVDVEPTRVGTGQREYDQVMHGVLVSDPETDMLTFEYSYNLEADPSNQLDILKQQNVLSTWDYLRAVLKETNVDPTDMFGSERG